MSDKTQAEDESLLVHALKESEARCKTLQSLVGELLRTNQQLRNKLAELKPDTHVYRTEPASSLS